MSHSSEERTSDKCPDLVYGNEVRKMKKTAESYLEKIFKEHEMIEKQLDARATNVKEREAELEKRETKFKEESVKFYSEKIRDHEMIAKQLDARETSVKEREAELKKRETKFMKERVRFNLEKFTKEREISERRKAVDRLEEHQREKEDINQKIVELEKKLDTKKALELALKVFGEAGKVGLKDTMDGEVQHKNKGDANRQDLNENIDHLESVNNVLVAKECKSNDELQEARQV